MKLKDEELKHIAKAVIEAEKRTSGEIIPYLVSRSGVYEHAYWRAGALFFILSYGILYSLPYLLESVARFYLTYVPLGIDQTLLFSLIISALGVLGTYFFPSWTNFFASDERMVENVNRRACEAFVGEEVFSTENRTGILLFVSLLERRVIVMGDAGINAKVTQDAWNDIVGIVTTGIRNKDIAGGIARGVDASGHLLKRCGVLRLHNDANEHADGLRYYER